MANKQMERERIEKERMHLERLETEKIYERERTREAVQEWRKNKIQVSKVFVLIFTVFISNKFS